MERGLESYYNASLLRISLSSIAYIYVSYDLLVHVEVHKGSLPGSESAENVVERMLPWGSRAANRALNDAK